MEKVFAMDTGEKFDVARLGSPSDSAGSDRDRDRDRGPPPRYGDRDFNRKFHFLYLQNSFQQFTQTRSFRDLIRPPLHSRLMSYERTKAPGT